MRPFLDRLAALLLEHHSNEMDRIAVVLPSRRAGSYLRKYLAQQHGGALWSPEIIDIGGFMQRCSGLAQGGTIDMLFLLYEAHRQVAGPAAEPLAEFLEWAPVTLRDMSEVDTHLIDHAQLYRDLREYHELEEWSFRLGEELSPAQERLNFNWRSTRDLHEALTALMHDRRMGTSGFVARVCTEQALAGMLNPPWKMTWFAGMNALDPASTAVIRKLQQQGLARVAWDADPHYLDDPRQEAGRYLRRSRAALGPGELPPLPAIRERDRTIHVVAAPQPLAQTTYVAQRLAALTPEERARTAVVLGDEDLLLPLLEQLPPDIGPLNVTMGLPLKALPVNGLTEAYIALLESATSDGRFALHELERLLGHPFVHEGNITARTIAALREQQQARVSAGTIIKALTESGSLHVALINACLVSTTTDPRMLSSHFIALFGWAKACAPNDKTVQEQLFQVARLQQRLDRTLERLEVIDLDLRTYASIRERLLREERIAFLGEPLQGLQLMGMLETRALDHERLIMVSVNEGVIPQAAALQSWIPHDIRRHHKLPLPADGEAITAYHFNRCMHLAQDVELVHVAGDGAEPGEPSRFIAQWQHEVVGHSNTRMEKSAVTAPNTARAALPIAVKKDEAVLARLRVLCERGLSPSAIGTWLRCPLDFYFRYVLGIRETEVADGNLGSDVLGDAVHNVLDGLLAPHIGHTLTPEAVEAMVPQVHRLLTDRLAKDFSHSTLEHGHFRLRREMATKAVETYLEAERDRCAASPTRVVAVELEVKATLSNGVLLKGRCDRIDLRDGAMTVLDVKTGSVRENDLRMPSLERGTITPTRRYALQLMIYLWAYLHQHPEVEQARAGVIPLQRPTQAAGEFLSIGGEDVIRRDQLSAIDELLTQLVDEMLDPQVPFAHDPESTYCGCCVA